MANTIELVRKNPFTLLSFAKAHGKMKTVVFTNESTGKDFRCCKFVNPENGDVTLVSFSRKLGELSPQEITAQKDELMVCDWEKSNGESGYTLYKPGQIGRDELDVDLF